MPEDTENTICAEHGHAWEPLEVDVHDLVGRRCDRCGKTENGPFPHGVLAAPAP